MKVYKKIITICFILSLFLIFFILTKKYHKNIAEKLDLQRYMPDRLYNIGKFFYNLEISIKRINNDYEIIEWSDNNINFELKNKFLYENTTNLGGKSDILRFEVLSKFGGIYMDYDFLQIKKFDDLLDYDFFAGTNEKRNIKNISK